MSALEQVAYDIIEARLTEGLDEDDELEWLAYPVSVRQEYLRHQAKLLSKVWQMTADNFSPEPIADFVTSVGSPDR